MASLYRDSSSFSLSSFRSNSANRCLYLSRSALALHKACRCQRKKWSCDRWRHTRDFAERLAIPLLQVPQFLPGLLRLRDPGLNLRVGIVARHGLVAQEFEHGGEMQQLAALGGAPIDGGREQPVDHRLRLVQLLLSFKDEDAGQCDLVRHEGLVGRIGGGLRR